MSYHLRLIREKKSNLNEQAFLIQEKHYEVNVLIYGMISVHQTPNDGKMAHTQYL